MTPFPVWWTHDGADDGRDGSIRGVTGPARPVAESVSSASWWRCATAPGAELLLQRATALAGRGGSAELFCVHVVRADGSSGGSSSELVELRRLTAAAGTGLHTVLGEDVPEALLQFARDVGATQLVLGVDPRGALRPFRSGRVGPVVSTAAALDVHLVPVPALDHSRSAGRRRGPLSPRRRLLGWLAAVALPLIASVIGMAAGDLIGPTSAALVFMLAVVGVALIGGLGAAVLAAVGATVLLNYFFTPPLHSFAVVEPQHLLALVLLLFAAVLVALVVHDAARRGQQAVRARAEAALLTDFAVTVMTEPDPLRLLLEKVREAFAATSVALLERDRDGWRRVAAAGSNPVGDARAGGGRRRRRRRPAPRPVRPGPDRRRTARPARGGRSGAARAAGPAAGRRGGRGEDAGPRPPSCAAPCSPRSATTCAPH